LKSQRSRLASATWSVPAAEACGSRSRRLARDRFADRIGGMANKHREPLGRRLDRALFTRPLFETVLFENRLTVADRAVVVAWTLRSVARYRWNQLRSVTGEMADIILFRVLAGGRVPCTGMTPLLRAGALVWYQVTDWS